MTLFGFAIFNLHKVNDMTSSSESMNAAERWCQIDPNPKTADYVKNLLERSVDDEKAMEELISMFPSDNRRISFGTAGLRAAMKPGPLGMNDLVIIQTAQ